MDKNIESFRTKILKEFGASDNDIPELLEYNQNRFNPRKPISLSSLPLKDEPFIDAWQKYARKTKFSGVFKVLKEVFIQLNFPIQKDISKTAAYLKATQQGVLDKEKQTEGIQLNNPEDIKLSIQQTHAGKIPIITIPDREDCLNIIRAISAKNEPVEIPDDFGASIFSGYNNWNRIWAYKQNFLNSNPPSLWHAEFEKLVEQKHLYQDKFIILSCNYYSNVTPETLGLESSKWEELSTIIRREHECTHYFSKRIFGSMQNNIFDEIIADYAGITAAIGEFRADWFLTFMGLENYPEYTKSGRLEVYKGNLSGNAFKVLQKIIVEAAKNLEDFSKEHKSKNEVLKLIFALTKLTLEELANQKSSLEQTGYL